MKKWRKWIIGLSALVLVNIGLFFASRILQSEPETSVVVPQKEEQAEPQKTPTSTYHASGSLSVVVE